jgi:transcriptional regulator with XRE-family HTH domain
MTLKQLFVVNLKKFRKEEGLSQEALAELCNVSANHIGQIEMGRRFPSIELIERMAAVLKVEPYRLFKDETGEEPDENQETREFLTKLPDRIRRDLKKQLLTAISDDIDEALKP